MAAYTRDEARAVALTALDKASGVTASAIIYLKELKTAAMTGVDTGRALVGSSAGGQSASFMLDKKPSERLVLFQAAIDYLNGARVIHTQAAFTNVLDA